jgi:general secretion pathway protein B
MSYILDALRKSDQQRHRGSSPTLLTAHDAPAAARQPAALWYGIIALVVLIAGITIGALRPWEHEAPAPAPAVAQPPLPAPVALVPHEVATVNADNAPARRSESAPVRTPAAPAVTSPNANIHPVTPAPAPAAAQLAATPSAIAPPPPSAAAVATQPRAAVPTTVVTAPPANVVTPPPAPAAAQLAGTAVITYPELPFAIQQEIPRLNVAVHAYSKEPKSRLVTIDNRLLHEGDDAAPGLKIEQITPDGMVFAYKGFRFRRSVQDIVTNR